VLVGRPVVIDTGCDWAKPIYLTAGDITALDRQTKKDVLAHNQSWQVNCKKQKNIITDLKASFP